MIKINFITRQGELFKSITLDMRNEDDIERYEYLDRKYGIKRISLIPDIREIIQK